jgi:GNAT superfamily N-acetyltransferase
VERPPINRLRWVQHWEADVSTAEHEALSGLLRAVYPNHWHTFIDGRDYSGARPEGRVIGFLDERPIAHLGFLRRTLRLDDGDDSILCGDVGLVGVDPVQQGSGLGLLLLKQSRAVFERLSLPFGFLTCRPAVVPFYERAGWVRIPGQVSRMLDSDLRPEVNTGPALVLPVVASLSEWPRGRTVVRDGLEV